MRNYKIYLNKFCLENREIIIKVKITPKISVHGENSLNVSIYDARALITDNSNTNIIIIYNNNNLPIIWAITLK